jgi:hypothetical protein
MIFRTPRCSDDLSWFILSAVRLFWHWKYGLFFFTFPDISHLLYNISSISSNELNCDHKDFSTLSSLLISENSGRWFTITQSFTRLICALASCKLHKQPKSSLITCTTTSSWFSLSHSTVNPHCLRRYDSEHLRSCIVYPGDDQSSCQTH